YWRKAVPVETPDGRMLTAFAYVARPTGVYRPAQRYLVAILEGARVHKLSQGYIALLEAISTED
ncbi:MAG TPA: gamma-glutamylcyclotransferase, partial [Candidatus Methylomirabilis sp.]|nr:gamma-glutamylcyclotransferase [Candidatus Methylomirabilis sp.]